MARPRGETREIVRKLFADGLTVGEIARKLDISAAAVSYHARKLGVPRSPKYAPRGDWEEIQAYYDTGHGVQECQEKFGFSRRSWGKAVQRGDIRPRPQAMPLESLLGAGIVRSRAHLKLRLFSSGLKEKRCEECGITAWLGEPLALNLHHVNGRNDDNRLENLRVMCPNCHSQTPNYARRSNPGTRRGPSGLVEA